MVAGDICEGRAYYLKTGFFMPFAACDPRDCIEVNHTTMFPFPDDPEELIDKLMVHFDFYR